MMMNARSSRASLAAPFTLAALVAFFGASASACSRADEPQRVTRTEPVIKASATQKTGGVRFVSGPPGPPDLPSIVTEERKRARAEGRVLVVYVGATWCKPCQKFHQAAKEGLIDGDLPNVTFLEFDLDLDRERLAPAGYVSEYVPFFAIPRDDGQAGRAIEGAVKGEDVVGGLVTRLKALVATAQ
jgi:thiol-disulfide isomerase/thioredoxin